MTEKTASGITRTGRQTLPHSHKKKEQRVKIPSLYTLRVNLQRRLKNLNEEEFLEVKIFIEDYCKAVFLQERKIKIRDQFKDSEVRSELISLLRLTR